MKPPKEAVVIARCAVTKASRRAREERLKARDERAIMAEKETWRLEPYERYINIIIA